MIFRLKGKSTVKRITCTVECMKLQNDVLHAHILLWIWYVLSDNLSVEK